VTVRGEIRTSPLRGLDDEIVRVHRREVAADVGLAEVVDARVAETSPVLPRSMKIWLGAGVLALPAKAAARGAMSGKRAAHSQVC